MNLRPAIDALTAAGVADPAGDARRLFAWAYEQGASAAEPQDRDAPNATTRAKFDAAIAARCRRQPVSQITGQRAFWRHDFVVTPDVLDPRPDTETLVEQALALPFSRVLDLGTGSGCILLSLLAERPQARGVGVDLSERALQVARTNAARLGVADRVDWVVSDWCAGVAGQFDLIVSNPPYIAAEEMPGLDPEVREHEPAMALTDGADGLTAYAAIAAAAPDHLLPGGHLMVEIGPTQAEAVAALFAQAGFDAIVVHRDLDGRDRVVAAQWHQ